MNSHMVSQSVGFFFQLHQVLRHGSTKRLCRCYFGTNSDGSLTESVLHSPLWKSSQRIGESSSEDSFDPRYDAWHRCNNLVHSWIVNSVTPNIAQSILYAESVADVWIELKERFAQGNSVRVAELQQELYMFKQGTMSVSEYFTQLKVFWEELENCRSIPRCRCDAMVELKEIQK